MMATKPMLIKPELLLYRKIAAEAKLNHRKPGPMAVEILRRYFEQKEGQKEGQKICLDQN